MGKVIEEDDIHRPPPYSPELGPQILTPDTARQGPLGSRVLVVLAGSLLLTFAAGVSLALLYAGH